MDQNLIKQYYFDCFCNYKIYLIDGYGSDDERKKYLAIMKKNSLIWDEEYQLKKETQLKQSNNFYTFLNLCNEYILSLKNFKKFLHFNEFISSLIISKYPYAKYFDYYYSTLHLNNLYLDFLKNDNLISYLSKNSKFDLNNLLKIILKIFSLDNYKYSQVERLRLIIFILTNKNKLLTNTISEKKYSSFDLKKIKRLYFKYKANYSLFKKIVSNNDYLELLKKNISLFDIEYRYKQLLIIKNTNNFIKFIKRYTNYLASIKEIDDLLKIENIVYSIITFNKREANYFNLYYNLILLNNDFLNDFKLKYNSLIDYLFNLNKNKSNQLLTHINHILKLDPFNHNLKLDVINMIKNKKIN